MSSPPDLCLLDTKYHFAEFIAFRLFSFLVNKTNFSYFIILYHCNISGWANFPYVQPIRINIFYRIIYAITIWRPRIVLLRQRILREPPSPIGIVHARPEIDIGKTPDARCPDDPSENSALPFRSTWPLCVRYRSPYFRMSRHYVPKNLHNAWIRCHRVCTPRSLYRRKVRYNTTPIPVNMNRRQVN